MLPIRLELENFYCHSNSVIDFNDFSAAVVVGKINGNDRFSNGSGKSTIFAAIKYVLFNEADTSSLEKIIKHNSDFCRVSFEFKTSENSPIYKVVRFRSKKAGPEARLFVKNKDIWNDLTQRTSTETDKEIIKIIKINYKTFANSVLSSQGDISGIASMTPREKKNALKEALQLGIYSKYEGAVKKKINFITKDIEKYQTILSTIGDPEKSISDFNKELIKINTQKQNSLFELDKYKNIILEVNNKISLQQSNLEKLNEETKEINEKFEAAKKDANLLLADIKNFSNKITIFKKQKDESLTIAQDLSCKLKELKQTKFRNEDDIQKDYSTNMLLLSDHKAEHQKIISDIDDLKIPLSNESVCKYCRQTIKDDFRDKCLQEINSKLIFSEKKSENISKLISTIQKNIKNLENELTHSRKSQKNIIEIDLNLNKEKEKIINLSSIIEEYEGLILSKEENLKIQNKLLEEMMVKKIESMTEKKLKEISINLSELKKQLNDNNEYKTTIMNIISEFDKSEAILSHQIKQKEEDKLKALDIKKYLSELEYKYTIHNKVMNAFGPTGIPTLITHTILNDYQVEANNFLDKLRPGLRLQFLIENERKDGEVSDTLDIIYFLNDAQLEFSQLSGAQKLLVSLSLRLGLAAVISKRLGIDLKMILIDEADAALDDGALEAFEMAIKELQNNYKILVITHNQELKTKFNHAIIVEQDNKLNSIAKVSNGW